MNHVIVWFVVGALFLVAELFTPAFVIVFFCVGAWAAAIMAAIRPGIEQELACFLLFSLFSLIFLRKKLVDIFQGRTQKIKQDAPEFPHAGRQAEVTKTIVAGEEGEVSMGGSFWRATSNENVKAGRLVRVLAPAKDDEILLVVEPIRQDTDGNDTLKQ